MLGGSLVTRSLVGDRAVGGTWSSVGTWTLPAVTLGGTVTGGNNNLTQIGRIGIGNTASNANYGIFANITEANPASEKAVLYGLISASETSAPNANILYGVRGYARLAATNTQNLAATPAGLVGVEGLVNIVNDGTGVVTGAASFKSTNGIGTSGYITNLYGLYITNASDGGGGVIYNQYGIYIEALTTGVTLNWGIYSLAAAYFDATVTHGASITFNASVESAAVADQVSLGGFEISAGHRALAISSEEVVVVETDETKFSHKLPVRINGATYNIMLTAT